MWNSAGIPPDVKHVLMVTAPACIMAMFCMAAVYLMDWRARVRGRHGNGKSYLSTTTARSSSAPR
jgi:hypothetical protein